MESGSLKHSKMYEDKKSRLSLVQIENIFFFLRTYINSPMSNYLNYFNRIYSPSHYNNNIIVDQNSNV